MDTNEFVISNVQHNIAQAKIDIIKTIAILEDHEEAIFNETPDTAGMVKDDLTEAVEQLASALELTELTHYFKDSNDDVESDDFEEEEPVSTPDYEFNFKDEIWGIVPEFHAKEYGFLQMSTKGRLRRLNSETKEARYYTLTQHLKNPSYYFYTAGLKRSTSAITLMIDTFGEDVLVDYINSEQRGYKFTPSYQQDKLVNDGWASIFTADLVKTPLKSDPVSKISTPEDIGLTVDNINWDVVFANN